MPTPHTPIDLGLGPLPFQATPNRPLLGLTVLVVEDSRFASEAIRLLCIRSGARIRRADSLQAAHRHLRVYRPSVAIIDLGLPDGSGLDLIKALTQGDETGRPIIIATSGADGEGLVEAALTAGADDFLAKPIEGVGQFQEMILKHLPEELRPRGLRSISNEGVDPDDFALAEDLAHIEELLTKDTKTLGYITPFLQGLARLSGDRELRGAADVLNAVQKSGGDLDDAIRDVRRIIKARVSVMEPV